VDLALQLNSLKFESNMFNNIINNIKNINIINIIINKFEKNIINIEKQPYILFEE
jgi:hypothetical protein